MWKKIKRASMLLAIIPIVTVLSSSTLYAQEEYIADDWDFVFKNFVIGAWYPPEIDEYQDFKDVGFNVVTQKVVYSGGIRDDNRQPEINIELTIDEAVNTGLKVIIGSYISEMRPYGPGPKVGGWCDSDIVGAETDDVRFPWKEEMECLHEDVVSTYVANHDPPLAEDPVVGYLLGDDIHYKNWTQWFTQNIPPTGRTYQYVETKNYLLNETPHLFPWIVQGTAPALIDLVEGRIPILSLQVYPTFYMSELPAAVQSYSICQQLEVARRVARKNGMLMWPVLSIARSGGEGEPSEVPLENLSLVRFSAYASLGYGAQGIWYYKWEHMNRKDGEGILLPDSKNLRDVVTEVNTHIANLSEEVLGSTSCGVFYTGWPPVSGIKVETGTGNPLIEWMSQDLLVGVLTRPDEGNVPMVMVVDRRVDDSGLRDVTVAFQKTVLDVTEVGAQSGKNTQWYPDINVATLENMNPGEGRLLSLIRIGSEPSPCVPGVASLCEWMEQRLDPANQSWDEDEPVMHVTFDELLDEHSGKWAADYAAGLNGVWLEESVMPIDGPIGFGEAVYLPEGTADGQVFGQVFDPYLPGTEEMTIALWVRPKLPDPLDEFGYRLLSVGSTWDMTDTIRARIRLQTKKDDYGQITNVRDIIGTNIPCSSWDAVGERPVADIDFYPSVWCDYPRQLEPPCPGSGFDVGWTHIAICLQGNTPLTSYINGEPITRGAPSDDFGSFNSGVNNIFIGRWVDRGEQYVGGIDDFQIYTKCLSEAEVNCLMKTPDEQRECLRDAVPP